MVAEIKPVRPESAYPPAGVSTFDEFYRAERGRVFAVVLLLTGDRTAAEDVVQESFALT
jgi:DNA-directed RNA polymerase specialized sigma24 family protein